MEFKDLFDKALQKTYLDGLKYDQNILPDDMDMFDKVELEEDYRTHGLLFGINLYNNLERLLNKEFNKIKKQNKKKGN